MIEIEDTINRFVEAFGSFLIVLIRLVRFGIAPEEAEK
jgi:hypothetical protein